MRTLTVCLGVAAFVAVGQIFIHAKFDRPSAPSLGLALATALVVIALTRASALSVIDRISASLVELGLRVKLAVASAAFCSLLLVARLVLDGFPNSGDEYAYVLQAMTYAQGRLWVQAPPLADAFQLWRFLAKDGIWVSQYEPGWAMVLTPAVWLGLPLWVVNPLIGTTLLAAIFALAREQVSRQAAWTAVIAVACSAFFMLNAASYFSHVSAALWGVLFALFGLRYLQTGDAWSAALAGVFVGLLGFTRAFNAAVFLVPFVAALLLTTNRRTGLLWLAVGGVPFFVALLVFNKAITGNALTMIPMWFGNETSIGLPNADTIGLMVTRFDLLSVFTSPLLPLGYALAFPYLWARGRLSFVDWIAVLTVIAFLLYPGSGGEQYGPRYYFEAFPFAALTIAKALDGFLFVQNRGPLSVLIAWALLAHLAFQVGVLIPRLQLEHDVVAQREDLFRKVESGNLSNAVVVVASGTGIIRSMSPGDLVRNGLLPGARSVIYALDLGEKNQALRTLFPDRQFYQYKDGNLQLVN
jgi:hypothetical protein